MAETTKTYIDCDMGKFLFDCVMQSTYESKLTITKHPVQEGANISDHAYLNPENITMQIGMSDCMQDITGYSAYTRATTRSISCYETLKQLQAERLPITIISKYGSFNNVLISSITVEDTYKSTFGLRATITFEQIQVAQVTTVKISKKPDKTDSTDEGTQNAIKVDRKSWEKQIQEAKGLR